MHTYVCTYIYIYIYTYIRMFICFVFPPNETRHDEIQTTRSPFTLHIYIYIYIYPVAPAVI